MQKFVYSAARRSENPAHSDVRGGHSYHHEAEAATHRRVRSLDDARAAGAAFRSLSGCHAALVTLGEQGMWLSSPDVEGAVAASAREVADVTGAGDTVVATLALALASDA